MISSNLYKVEELLNKYEKLVKAKMDLENNISNVENEMKSIINGLNNTEVKQLQKKYPNKEFIAKK